MDIVNNNWHDHKTQKRGKIIMWFSLLMTILPMTGITDTNPSNDLGIEVGQKWADIDHDTRVILKNSPHWKVDNRKYFSSIEAPNTDNCLVQTNDCQPDYEHHIFKVANSVNKGSYFIVTFSYNYRVLRVEDTYNHKG